MPVCKMVPVDYLNRTGCGRLKGALFYYINCLFKMVYTCYNMSIIKLWDSCERLSLFLYNGESLMMGAVLMKSIKETLKALTVIFMVLFTAYLAFAHINNWQTIAIVALVLLVVIQLFYKPFHIIKLGNKYAVEFDGKSHNLSNNRGNDEQYLIRLERLEQRVNKCQKQIEKFEGQLTSLSKQVSTLEDKSQIRIHKLTFSEQMQSYCFTNNLDDFTKEQEPIDIKGLYHTIEYAKKNGQFDRENYYYLRIVDKYSESYMYHLINRIKGNCKLDVLRNVESFMYKAVKYPYSKSTLLSIKDDLTNDTNNTQLSYEFDKLIKDLDMLY